MNRVTRNTAAVITVLAGLLAVPTTASAATTCTATLLPTLPDTTAYEVTGTDGAGTFAGSAVDDAGLRHGVVWRDGAVTKLDQRFVPSDVNESGLMGGYVVDSGSGYAIAALRTFDGPVRRLTASYSTWVVGVNDAGDAVGGMVLQHPVVRMTAVWYAPDYSWDGFFGPGGVEPTEIDETGLAIGLADYPDTVDTVWAAVPNAGQIIRQYGPETGVRLYDLDDGVIAATHSRRIVIIDGRTGAETAVPGSAGGVPVELNDGVIVGSVRRTATMWRGGETAILPAVPGTTTREASAVNETGTDVAGISVTEDGVIVPTRWTCG